METPVASPHRSGTRQAGSRHGVRAQRTGGTAIIFLAPGYVLADGLFFSEKNIGLLSCFSLKLPITKILRKRLY